MARERILVVDDEEDILQLMRYNLEKEGYEILSSTSGEDALLNARRERPHLIILDLMLPGVDGIEVCKQLRQEQATADVPILMVTAKSEETDMILGLEVGADDYITKPFSPKVLIARVRAILRRSRKTALSEHRDPTVSIHNITIDTTKHEVLVSGEKISLSVTEFYILGQNESGELVADDYPSTATVGEPTTVGIGLGATRGPVEGRVVASLERVTREGDTVRIRESRRLGRFNMSVAPGETTVRRHTVQLPFAGERLRLTYRLYRQGSERPLRQVHIWLTVTQSR